MTATAAAPAAQQAREDTFAQASQAQLIWWRFRKHKLAVASLVIVVLFYLVAAFADFLATTDPHASDARRSYIPPQMIRLFDTDGNFNPHVQALRGRLSQSSEK